MSSKLEKIYAVMPVGVQNLMVTVKGWDFARRRYSKKFHKNVNNLMRSQWFPREQFYKIQTVELRNPRFLFLHVTLNELQVNLQSDNY